MRRVGRGTILYREGKMLNLFLRSVCNYHFATQSVSNTIKVVICMMLLTFLYPMLKQSFIFCDVFLETAQRIGETPTG
jgi:hypothetical protein